MSTDQHAGRVEHVPGEWRDLPRGDAGYVRPHTPVVKSSGLDWDALTPKCRRCGTPSGQLADGALCPTCRGVKPVDVFATGRTTKTAVTRSTGVTSTYDQLDDDQVTRRYSPDPASLETPAAVATSTPAATAGPKTTAPDVSRSGGRLAADADMETARRPATTHQETTVTSPPFPTYIVDIAVVMRDSEDHHDPAVRAARKAVANALVGLNRELTRVGSPAASTRPDQHLGSRPSPVRDHHDEVVRRYLAGESTNAIAKAIGVTGSAIRQYLKRTAITRITNPTGATA